MNPRPVRQQLRLFFHPGNALRRRGASYEAGRSHGQVRWELVRVFGESRKEMGELPNEHSNAEGYEHDYPDWWVHIQTFCQFFRKCGILTDYTKSHLVFVNNLISKLVATSFTKRLVLRNRRIQKIQRSCCLLWIATWATVRYIRSRLRHYEDVDGEAYFQGAVRYDAKPIFQKPIDKDLELQWSPHWAPSQEHPCEGAIALPPL